jgi:HEAT repeat protein
MNDTLGALIQGIASPDRGLRLHCVERLVQLGDGAVPRLCESLRTGGLLEKCSAASALGRIGDRAATSALLVALSSSETVVREHAAVALGDLGDPAAVPQLCGAARTGNVFLAPKAVEALGRIGDVRALETLTQLLRGMDTPLRIAAAQALGRMRHPGAVTPLCDALLGDSLGLFIQACRALGEIGSPQCVPAICFAMLRANRFDDPAEALRIGSEVLLQIGPEAIPNLTQYLGQHWTRAFDEALTQFGPLALPALAETLRTGSKNVRLHALEIIEQIGSKEPRAYLLAREVLQNSDAAVRLEAVRVLAGSDEPSVADDARALLKDSASRVAALSAAVLMARQPEQGLVSAAVSALNDPELRVVITAAGCLATAARRSPCSSLRAATPALRRRMGGVFSRVSADQRDCLRAALTVIEQATAAVQDLPVPAASGNGSEAFPLPASPTPANPEGLPIPGRGACRR